MFKKSAMFVLVLSFFVSAMFIAAPEVQAQSLGGWKPVYNANVYDIYAYDLDTATFIATTSCELNDSATRLSAASNYIYNFHKLYLKSYEVKNVELIKEAANGERGIIYVYIRKGTPTYPKLAPFYVGFTGASYYVTSDVAWYPQLYVYNPYYYYLSGDFYTPSAMHSYYEYWNRHHVKPYVTTFFPENPVASYKKVVYYSFTNAPAISGFIY